MPDTNDFISSYPRILQSQGLNIYVPTLDVTMFYESVSCLERGIKRAMFEFAKNEECYDVYEQVGFSPPPDEEYIYLSTKDIREESSLRNIVKFRANNKSYRIVFEDVSQANYFLRYKVIHKYDLICWMFILSITFPNNNFPFLSGFW